MSKKTFFLLFFVTFCQIIDWTFSEVNIEDPLDVNSRMKRLINARVGVNISLPRAGIRSPELSVVNIRLNNVSHCVGNLLSKGWVLTAGRCYNPHQREHYGIYSVSRAPAENLNIKYLIKNVTAFTYHNVHQVQDNLILIELEDLMTLRTTVRDLVEVSYDLAATGEQGKVWGWGPLRGAMNPHPWDPQERYVLDAWVMEQTTCKQAYHGVYPDIPQRDFCTHYEPGKFTSRGDLGAPLHISSDLVGVLVLIGHDPHYGNHRPDIFVNVASPLIRQWIIDTTEIPDIITVPGQHFEQGQSSHSHAEN